MNRVKWSLIFAGAFAGFVGVVEALPAAGQWIGWAMDLILDRVSGSHASIFQVARSSPDYSWLSFHGLPSAIASPLSFTVCWVCFKLTGVVDEVQNAARRRRGDLTEDEVHAAIEARKYWAKNANIAGKIAAVISAFGHQGVFCNKHIELTNMQNQIVAKVSLDTSWTKVFEARYIPGRIESTRRRVLRPAGGKLELATDVEYQRYPESYEIESYLPGEWEESLKTLSRSANEYLAGAEREREQATLAARESALRKNRERFGL
jgi:hypothetical protein